MGFPCFTPNCTFRSSSNYFLIISKIVWCYMFLRVKIATEELQIGIYIPGLIIDPSLFLSSFDYQGKSPFLRNMNNIFHYQLFFYQLFFYQHILYILIIAVSCPEAPRITQRRLFDASKINHNIIGRSTDDNDNLILSLEEEDQQKSPQQSCPRKVICEANHFSACTFVLVFLS